MEEVGLKVKNIQYYKSQPWSLSSSLLMGFYCDLDGSDHIVLEEDELSEAEWFEREDIPYDDYDVSLTREMMIQFKKGWMVPSVKAEHAEKNTKLSHEMYKSSRSMTNATAPFDYMSVIPE